jgi:hypothetical protein
VTLQQGAFSDQFAEGDAHIYTTDPAAKAFPTTTQVEQDIAAQTKATVIPGDLLLSANGARVSSGPGWFAPWFAQYYYYAVNGITDDIGWMASHAAITDKPWFEVTMKAPARLGRVVVYTPNLTDFDLRFQGPNGEVRVAHITGNDQKVVDLNFNPTIPCLKLRLTALAVSTGQATVREIEAFEQAGAGAATPVVAEAPAATTAANIQMPAAPRDKILARVEELCSTVDWKDDLDFFQPSFHPELPPDPPAYEHALAQLLDQMPPYRRLFFEILFTSTPDVINDSLFAALRYRAINWLADYAIEGDFIRFTPLPINFDPEPITVPFAEDKYIVAYVSRFSNVRLIADRLIARYEEEFIPRRKQAAANADRHVWIIGEHREIQETQPEDLPRGYVYDILLKRFLASQWAYQIAKHDLNATDGREAAKAVLRDNVRQAKAFIGKAIPSNH